LTISGKPNPPIVFRKSSFHPSRTNPRPVATFTASVRFNEEEFRGFLRCAFFPGTYLSRK
jgi:hypothetical protein